MRMYRIAMPLPLDDIPIERGEERVDYILTDKMIEELDKKFGFVENIGSGLWGVAYRLADGRVLKLTTDEDEVAASTEIMNIKYGPFAKVYDVQEISDGKGHMLNYILKDYVQPLDESMADLFDIFQDLPFDRESVVDEFRNSHPAEFKMFEDYTNDVLNYPFGDTLHSNNVGIDQNGQLVAFDPRTNRW